MNPIETLTVAVHQVRSRDDWLELLNQLRFLKQCIKEAEAALEQKGVEIIERLGPIQCGEITYVVGEDKSWKPQLLPEAMFEKLLEGLGGELDALKRCLAAGCFKAGQTRIELGESLLGVGVFTQLFKQETRKFVDSTPIKRVKEFRPAFVKPRKQLGTGNSEPAGRPEKE